MLKEKLLHRNNEYQAIYLKNNGHIKIAIAGRSISKPLENWITDDTVYSNRILINEINSLKERLSKYEEI